MDRARLFSINGKPVGAEDYSDERARRQIEREFNLTYLSELPSENKITEGAWFGPEDLEHGAVSVEHWIAERFGIRPGDALEFLSAGPGLLGPGAPLRHLALVPLPPRFFFTPPPAL